MSNMLLDMRKGFVVTAEQAKLHWGGRKDGSNFACRLCGHRLKEGDKARWIYANSTPGMHTGNFFVCGDCDGSDEDVLARAKASFEQAVKLAKQWNIYGPDWAQDLR